MVEMFEASEIQIITSWVFFVSGAYLYFNLKHGRKKQNGKCQEKYDRK